MSNNVIKVKATNLKKFLNEKGYKVKHAECIEAVSRVETGKCYNVAKKDAIRILKSGEKLSFKEMKDNDFSISVVVSMDLDTLMQGIDTVNDVASEMITGSECALCDISYEVYPYNYGDSGVAIHVKGYIEEVETLQYLEGYEEQEED